MSLYFLLYFSAFALGWSHIMRIMCPDCRFELNHPLGGLDPNMRRLSGSA